MVAMVICTVGLMSMAQLMAITLRMQQLGRNSTSAVRMAQDKIDELTTQNFVTSLMISCGGSLTNDLANHFDNPNGVTNYKRRWIVTAGPDGSNTLRTVTVRVIPDVKDRRVSSQVDLTSIVRGVAGAVCP